jgi:hypothetical protein
MNAIQTRTAAKDPVERHLDRSSPVRRLAGSLEALEVHAFELSKRRVQQLILAVEVVLQHPGGPTRLLRHRARRGGIEPVSPDDAQCRLRELTPPQFVIHHLRHASPP